MATTADRSVQAEDSTVKLWIGLLDAEFEGSYSVAESEVPRYSFVTTDGIENVLPFGPALAAVARDHFTFLSAEESVQSTGPAAPQQLPVVSPSPAGADSPYERRFETIENALGLITEQLKSLASAAAPAASPQAVSGVSPKPPDLYTGLDPGAVQHALQAGVSTEALGELASLARDPTGSRLREPPLAAAASTAKLTQPPGLSSAFSGNPATIPAPPAPPMELGSADIGLALTQLTQIVGHLHDEKAKKKAEEKDLEAMLDKAEGSGSQRDGSLGGYSRSKAAALRLLQQTLLKQPKLIYESIEKAMADDWHAAGSAPGLATPAVTSRGWLEHRSRIQNYQTSVRYSWIIGGIHDALRENNMELARARAALGVAVADQTSCDRGSFLLSQELTLEASPPFAAFATHQLPEELGNATQPAGGQQVDGPLHGQDQRSIRVQRAPAKAGGTSRNGGSSCNSGPIHPEGSGQSRQGQGEERQGNRGPELSPPLAPGQSAPTSNAPRFWKSCMRWLLSTSHPLQQFLHSYFGKPCSRTGSHRFYMLAHAGAL